MVATSARVAFITQHWRTVKAENSATKTRYGEKARDSGPEPVETFFDNIADAQVMADARLALLGADRRRFRQDVNQALSLTGTLDYSQTTPAVAVIDDERSAAHSAAAVEFGIRPGEDRSTIISWG